MLEKAKEVGSLGSEHKPGTNENVGSAVKRHVETTGRDIHPNYASVLKTGVWATNNNVLTGATSEYPATIA